MNNKEKVQIFQFRIGILLIAAMFFITFSDSQAQNYYTGAGITYTPEGTNSRTTQRAGFYLSVGLSNKLIENLGFGDFGYLGELQFINQKSKPFKINSGSSTFMFTYGKKLMLGTGFQINIPFYDNLEEQEIDPYRGGSVTQLNLMISNKLQVQARYTDLFKGNFDKIIQTGVVYRL